MPDMDRFATHLRLTVAAALKSAELWVGSGILELGCGDYSTPILYEIAKNQKRPFRFVSSDEKWARRFPFANHSIIESTAWQKIDFCGDWGMVLLDNEELVVDRFKQIERLSPFARCIVFHDADTVPQRGLDWLDCRAFYKHILIDRTYTPSAALLSNEEMGIL